MSYPFIGLEGLGYKKYDAKTIERMLREGRHIFDTRFGDMGSQGVSCFEDGKFKFSWPEEEDGKPVWRVREFKSFVELAAFVAFYGEDFL